MDGIFRAALTSPQDFFQVDGGRPIYADGPIVLCDRADHFPGRTFDGNIAQLSIYDAALTENNVRLCMQRPVGGQLSRDHCRAKDSASSRTAYLW